MKFSYAVMGGAPAEERKIKVDLSLREYIGKPNKAPFGKKMTSTRVKEKDFCIRKPKTHFYCFSSPDLHSYRRKGTINPPRTYVL